MTSAERSAPILLLFVGEINSTETGGVDTKSNPNSVMQVPATKQFRRRRWSMVRIFCRYVADETGATAIEYALIASLIAVFLIGALAALGTRVSGEFSEVSGALQ